MKKRKFYLKSAFKIPNLYSGRKTILRNVSPMELFFDLAFILPIAKIHLLFAVGDPFTLFEGAILYFYFILTWSNVTLYNVYFWNENGTYFIRFFLVIIMIPVILMASINEITTTTVNFLIVNLIFIKSVVSIVWVITVNRTKYEEGIHLKQVMNKYFFVRLGSVLILIVALFSDKKYLVYFLLGIIIYEFFMQKFVTTRKRKQLNFYLLHLDRHLLKERIILLVMLIFSEGVLLISQIFSFDKLSISLLVVIMIFLSISFFFLRIYYDFHLLKLEKGYEDKYVANIYIGTLSFLVLFSVLENIGHAAIEKVTVDFFTHILLCILLLYFALFHLANDIAHFKNKKILWNYNRGTAFSEVDIVFNIIMVFLAISTIFIKNPLTLILVIFIYYVIHLVPTFFDAEYNENNFILEGTEEDID